jgi:cytoskeleton protein RodZ
MDSQETQTVGFKLREARDAKGASIEDVAAEIMVPQHYLLAIEEDRYTALPGQTYAIGFVRNYSRYLDLPADEIVSQLKSEVSFPKTLDTVEIASGFVAPPKQNVLPSGPSIAAGLCVAVGVYGLWFAASVTQPLDALPAALPDVVLAPSAKEKDIIRAQVASIAPAMASTAAAVTVPSAETVAGPKPAKVQKTAVIEKTAVGVDDTQEAPQSAPVVEKPVLSKTQIAALEAQSASSDADTPETAQEAAPLETVKIHVEEETWFEIRTEGKIYYSGIKQAGDVLEVPGDRAANSQLTTGNAGGIWLSVGDWSSKTLGKPGRVRRNLALAPGELISVLASADPS